MAKTVVALFDSLNHAQETVQDLLDSGFERDNISLIANASAKEYSHYFDGEGRYAPTSQTVQEEDDMTAGEGAGAGAGVGAAVGGIGGLLMGLGLLAVPGVGPALAAGPLVSALVGAGLGAAAGGLVGALVTAGVPQEEAGHYAEGVRRGGSLVAVTAEDAEIGAAADLMERHQPVNLKERVALWQQETGYRSFDEKAEAYSAAQIAEEREKLGITVVDDEKRASKR